MNGGREGESEGGEESCRLRKRGLKKGAVTLRSVEEGREGKGDGKGRKGEKKVNRGGGEKE